MLALETSGAILDQDEVRDDFVPNSNDREDASNSTNDKEQEYVFFENKYLGEEWLFRVTACQLEHERFFEYWDGKSLEGSILEALHKDVSAKFRVAIFQKSGYVVSTSVSEEKEWLWGQIDFEKYIGVEQNTDENEITESLDIWVLDFCNEEEWFKLYRDEKFPEIKVSDKSEEVISSLSESEFSREVASSEAKEKTSSGDADFLNGDKDDRLEFFEIPEVWKFSLDFDDKKQPSLNVPKEEGIKNCMDELLFC